SLSWRRPPAMARHRASSPSYPRESSPLREAKPTPSSPSTASPSCAAVPSPSARVSSSPSRIRTFAPHCPVPPPPASSEATPPLRRRRWALFPVVLVSGDDQIRRQDAALGLRPEEGRTSRAVQADPRADDHRLG